MLDSESSSTGEHCCGKKQSEEQTRSVLNHLCYYKYRIKNTDHVVGIISDTVHKPEMNEKFLIRSFLICYCR
jgi:hypothetical protein